MTDRLTIDGAAFRDPDGRHVILRGVNLGGDTKLPYTPDGHTYRPTDFADHRTVSFVGRPAPLSEIDEHLARIAHWGFNCLRLLTTWEAVEHAGPGIYDEAYLDYYAEVCRRAGRHGLRVFVDFHQDVWSRMTGGDGAPGWTFETAGLDITKFHETGSALLMQHNYDQRLGGRQPSYPTMSWGGNYARPANGIMWTLFFAGADFAPSAIVDGKNIQHYLQDHYFGAMRAVAERIVDLDNVIGFDTLNEPGTGYIGKAMSDPLVRGEGPLWTPLEGLAVASGLSRDLPSLEFGQGMTGTRSLNAGGKTIWLPSHEDPFRSAGAWTIEDGQPVALIEDYFQRRGNAEVDHERDYMLPFFHRVADTVRELRSDWLLFAEIDPFDAAKGQGFPQGMPERTVNASHWYDISALVTKRFDVARMTHVFTGEVREGPQAIEDAYTRELSVLRSAGDGLGFGAPTLIGECGIQYDMNEAEAYRKWGAGDRAPAIWDAQAGALGLMYNAMDRLLLSSTQWNYTVSNSNDPMIGDGWNQEDLSIWSKDQTIPNEEFSGGRAVEGFSRPYVRAAQGSTRMQRFVREGGYFEAEIEIDEKVDSPTEIFVPVSQYPNGYRCRITPPVPHQEVEQMVFVLATTVERFSIRIERI